MNVKDDMFDKKIIHEKDRNVSTTFPINAIKGMGVKDGHV